MIINAGSRTGGVIQASYTGEYAGGGTVYPYTAPYGLVDTNSLFSGQVYEDGSEFRIVTGPSNGTLDASGAESGNLWGNDVDDIYTPTAGYTGDDSVTLEVKYIDGTTAQWVATIAVEAAATEVPQGTWTIGTITTDETTASLTPSYSLTDATSYQYSINSGDWVTFTGTISLTSLADETAFSGALRATNSVGSGASASFAFTTDRIPVPPTVSTALPDLNLSEGEAVSINLDSYFAGAVSYSATGLPSGLTLSGSVISGTAQAGSATVTVTATNADGSISDSFATNIASTGNPVINLTGSTNITLEAGTAYVEPGFSAISSGGINLTGDVSVFGNVDDSSLGDYELEYVVSDADGNVGIATRYISVVDTLAPTLTLTDGNINLAVGGTYSEPGFSATDAFEGDLTGSVMVAGTVDTSKDSTGMLVYTVSDSSGNAVTRIRRVIVGTGGRGIDRRSIAQSISSSIHTTQALLAELINESV